MNLIIDIGNTIAKIAVFDGLTMVEMRYCSNQNLNELKPLCVKYIIEKGIVSSVIELIDTVREQLKAISIPLLYLDHSTPLPITNLYKTPETLGYDRIAAVVAANGEFPNRDILVVDAGTCITYEFIDSHACYHGGNISPGVQMRFKALHAFTGKLPLVDSEGDKPTMGYNTDTAIRMGVYKGIENEVLGYINALTAEYPDLFVFLTGGDGFSFDAKIKNSIFADKLLVLKGLNRILRYNDDKF